MWVSELLAFREREKKLSEVEVDKMVFIQWVGGEYGSDVSQDDSDKEVLEERMMGVMHIGREGGGRVLSRGRGRPKYNSG